MSIKVLENKVRQSQEALDGAKRQHEKFLDKAVKTKSQAKKAPFLARKIQEGESLKDLSLDMLQAEAEAVAMEKVVIEHKDILTMLEDTHRTNERELGKAIVDKAYQDARKATIPLLKAYEKIAVMVSEVAKFYHTANDAYQKYIVNREGEVLKENARWEISQYEQIAHSIRHFYANSDRSVAVARRQALEMEKK